MGPLKGLQIIEIAGLGPSPFAGMMLADMGADVIRVERPGGGYFAMDPAFDFLNRGKRCIAVDLKNPKGVDIVKQLVSKADAFTEGFRPGVAERLGLGPEVLTALNPKLVYGRMTGWGQTGPMAHAVGHDINYISLTGALHAIGEQGGKPQIPLNVMGDFGGGGMLFAFGLVSALLEAQKTGQGQVVDAAMVDGVAAMMAMTYSAHQIGFWSDERGTNMADSGAHFYNTYACADGEYISVGAIEAQFYAVLLQGLGLNAADLPEQMDQGQWPAMKETFTRIFLGKTRAQWEAVFAGTNACVTPVLKMSEVAAHPHIQARNTIVEVAGKWQPAPAPRFSRTPGEISHPPAKIGEHTHDILKALGLDADMLSSEGVVS